MRLLKIKFNGKLLDNLTLDFTLNNEAARFIILAGENGTGKTTILNTIPILSNTQTGVTIEEVIFELNNQDVQSLIKIDAENSNNSGFDHSNLSVEDFGEKPIISISKKRDQFSNSYIAKISGTKEFYYIHGAKGQRGNAVQIFLNRALFKLWHNNTEPTMDTVLNVSNYEVDDDTNINSQKYVIDLNNEINIPQLLVDLDNKDAVEFRNNYNSTKQTDPALANRRIDRFKHAFNGFFDNNLTFEEITPNHEVIFRKGEDKFGINNLSSGEKMIIQCSASLLKDAGLIGQTSFVLIDEPEQALHPKWQEKILDLYANITSLDKKYEPQILISTHSEHVLKNALCRKDVLIILLRIDSETKKLKAINMSREEYLLNYPSYDEIKYRAFGILSQDYHDDLLGFIQEVSGMNCKNQDKKLLKDANCPKKHWHGKNTDGSLNTNLDTDSLPFYIRHYMHHPELRDKTDNKSFSTGELEKSISFLENYIKNNVVNG